MAYTNSPLATVKILSPNHSGLRNHPIDTITIHCVVGQCSAKTIGEIFQPTARQASSNYGIGKDGEIGLYVEEKNRSWCSSSGDNDHRAITIEVASDTTEPYAVNDKAYAALIELVADICKRNGIKKLLWRGDKSLVGQVDKQNMTVHRWFAATACPGTFLYEKHGDIAAKVNAKLGVTEEKVEVAPTSRTVKIGEVVTFKGTKHYPSANSQSPVSCKAGKATISSIYEGGKHPYHLIRVRGGTSSVYGWVDADDIEELMSADTSFKVGDVVMFKGKTHYSTANSPKGVACKGGKAKITQIYQLGKSKHPYHLVSVDGGATVHGWVNEGTFTKA